MITKDSYHIIEEAAALNPYGNHIFLISGNLQAVNRAHRILDLRPCAAEALKIMLPHKKSRCPAHPLHLHRETAEGGIQALLGKLHRPI